MSYCAAVDVTDQLKGVDLTPLGDSAAQDAAVSAAMQVAGCEVDLRCRRTFAPPEMPSTKTFDGTGGPVLRVPDMVRLDNVTVCGTVVVPAYAYPQDGPPYRWIATGGRFEMGYRNVSVTGLWGFADAVPADVKRATACLAAAEILGRLQADRSGGTAMQVTGLEREQYPDGGPYGDRIENLGATACRLLLPYRRWIV